MRERECSERDLFCNAERLDDEELIAGLKRCVAQERAVTARLLVHFGEVDARGLYRDQGYDSMFACAVIGLHMSEAEAMVRIRVSRLGRAFPLALQMLARGEVPLTALKLLAPVLTRDNLGLLDEVRFKSKQQVLELLAKHFPKPDAETSIRRLPSRVVDGVTGHGAALPLMAAGKESPKDAAVVAVVEARSVLRPESCAAERSQLCEARLETSSSAPSVFPGVSAVTELRALSALAQAHPPSVPVEASAVAEVHAPSAAVEASAVAEVHAPSAAVEASAAAVADATVALPSRPVSTFCLTPPCAAGVVPLSAGRYKIQFTADERVRDKLKLAQDLLRHQVPGGDVAVVVERALDLLIALRKKQLFAETSKPRRLARSAESQRAVDDGRLARSRSEAARLSRHIPHSVRREVVGRDGVQCCFVGPDGARCAARGRLEFHHQVPYARGGPAASDNVQLLCRAHNALMAERDFGQGFMRAQRGPCP
jgi:hypothetical protein